MNIRRVLGSATLGLVCIALVQISVADSHSTWTATTDVTYVLNNHSKYPINYGVSVDWVNNLNDTHGATDNGSHVSNITISPGQGSPGINKINGLHSMLPPATLNGVTTSSIEVVGTVEYDRRRTAGTTQHHDYNNGENYALEFSWPMGHGIFSFVSTVNASGDSNFNFTPVWTLSQVKNPLVAVCVTPNKPILSFPVSPVNDSNTYTKSVNFSFYNAPHKCS